MHLTPDGKRYLAMAAGRPQPLPFHLRWLPAAVCGQSELRWIALNVVSIVVLVALTALFAAQHGATPAQAATAALLLAGLPFIRFHWSAPVLVDMPALALVLGAAVAYPAHQHIAAVLVILSAACSEKAPVWAAIFAWEPMMLGALIVPILRALLFKRAAIDPRDPLAWTLNPFTAGLRAHKGHWRNPMLLVLPWGACLAVILSPVPPVLVLVALAAGYALLLVATDSVRLYQQAAPAVCVAAALVIPEQWVIPALVAHWFNPWIGNGV